VGGVLIPATRFADDQAMVSHTVRGLQVIMDALQDTSEKYNMRINTKKTKIMRMSTVEGRTMKITVNGQNLERVKQFCYFGSLMTEDCRSCHEEGELLWEKRLLTRKVTSCEDLSDFT